MCCWVKLSLLLFLFLCSFGLVSTNASCRRQIRQTYTRDETIFNIVGISTSNVFGNKKVLLKRFDRHKKKHQWYRFVLERRSFILWLLVITMKIWLVYIYMYSWRPKCFLKQPAIYTRIEIVGELHYFSDWIYSVLFAFQKTREIFLLLTLKICFFGTIKFVMVGFLCYHLHKLFFVCLLVSLFLCL